MGAKVLSMDFSLRRTKVQRKELRPDTVVSAITSGGPTDTKSITSEVPTDMKFYYQWRSNFDAV